METAWRTDKGKVRPHNEDAVELFRTDFGSLVAVVADGMGGHRSGEVASRQAVQLIRRELRSLSPDASTEEQKKRLLDAVVKAIGHDLDPFEVTFFVIFLMRKR